MIIFIIIIALVFMGVYELSCASDWQSSEYNNELRHQELMECIESTCGLSSYDPPAVSHIEDRDIDRIMMRDEYGQELWEERIHEHIEDWS